MARDLLDSGIPCDAVICSSDWQVAGLRRVFQDQARRPPTHSGFDNHHLVIKNASDLTTIDYQDGLLGWHGVGELLKIREGVKSRQPFTMRIRLPLVIRSSCGCLDKAVDPIWPEREASFLFPESDKIEILRGLMKDWDPSSPETGEKWKRLIQEEGQTGPETLRLRSFLSECFSGRGALRPGALEDALREAEDREDFVREQTRTRQSYLLAGFVPKLGQDQGLEKIREALGDLMDALGVAHWELETDPEKKDQVGRIFLSGETAHSAFLPLFWNGEWVGSLSWTPGDRLEMISTWLRYFLASQIAASQALHKEREARLRLHDAISLLEQNNLKLVELSEKDPLTGLYNRRGFASRAETLWQRAQASRRPCMLIFADLDGLKQINDLHGHEAGDLAIAAAGQCLARCLRKTDLLCRMGGDEFTGMLLGVDERSLKVIGNRLDRITEAWNREKKLPWRLAISLGGRARPADPEITFNGHLALADEALYEMKKKRKASRQGPSGEHPAPGVK
ncbi:MAG: diguanylate cyclase [Spirochaetia bacterium]|nr:diguanylate cyclase [Spirochaetia bacterium]